MSDTERLDASPPPPRLTGVVARRSMLGLMAAVVVAVLLYYPIGMIWVHRIDDDPDFAAGEAQGPPDGASRAVAVAVALIEREVDAHRWTANDPFFLPSAALDNMPNFQQGVVAALSRFVIEMRDRIGRVRGTSREDADLKRAAGQLSYDGTVWIVDLRTSWWTLTASSEKQYRAARRALIAYNDRLAAGDAVFERRTDNLLDALERIAANIGSDSAVIHRHIEEHSGDLLDLRGDDIFYWTKGGLYANYLLLRELAGDFANVIEERELTAVWANMLASFRAAATLRPWVVVNGDPGGQVLPSHLAAQGFYLLRARTQLKEVTNILLK
ncbi:MAG: DUF2333 family protein [Kiloniellales bacterium]